MLGSIYPPHSPLVSHFVGGWFGLSETITPPPRYHITGLTYLRHNLSSRAKESYHKETMSQESVGPSSEAYKTPLTYSRSPLVSTSIYFDSHIVKSTVSVSLFF